MRNSHSTTLRSRTAGSAAAAGRASCTSRAVSKAAGQRRQARGPALAMAAGGRRMGNGISDSTGSGMVSSTLGIGLVGGIAQETGRHLQGGHASVLAVFGQQLLQAR